MSLFWIILAAVGGFLVFRQVFLSRRGLDLPAARAALQSGAAVLVDVREPGEWRGGVAKEAALLPLSDLRGTRTQWRAFLAQHPGKKLLLYCQSGMRSGMAAAQLRGEGVDAVNVGSLGDWDRAGWPVVSPKA